jgi:hypothetical protein
MNAARSRASPLERKRPPTVGAVKRAKFENLSSKIDSSEPAQILQWASRLDRIADAELHLGHHVAAEQLSRRAAELREALS